jgi:hypothetical protein
MEDVEISAMESESSKTAVFEREDTVETREDPSDGAVE